jgi:hypothetical protein
MIISRNIERIEKKVYLEDYNSRIGYTIVTAQNGGAADERYTEYLYH